MSTPFEPLKVYVESLDSTVVINSIKASESEDGLEVDIDFDESLLEKNSEDYVMTKVQEKLEQIFNESIRDEIERAEVQDQEND